MPNLKDLITEINKYSKDFRNPMLTDFNIGGLYDLFPNKNNPQPEVMASWPDTWINANKAGIYAFLSEELKILYIGKASMKSNLGYRLGKYCSYNNDKSCALNVKWIGESRYVLTVGMPNSSRFEAPALEEYLIGKIHTDNNKVGT